MEKPLNLRPISISAFDKTQIVKAEISSHAFSLDDATCAFYMCPYKRLNFIVAQCRRTGLQHRAT